MEWKMLQESREHEAGGRSGVALRWLLRGRECGGDPYTLAFSPNCTA